MYLLGELLEGLGCVCGRRVHKIQVHRANDNVIGELFHVFVGCVHAKVVIPIIKHKGRDREQAR